VLLANKIASGRPRAVRLVDVKPSDTTWIGRAVGEWACSERWSSIWAMTPSPEIIAGKLWHDVPWQQVAMRGRAPAGLFQLNSVNLDDGVGRLDFIVDPRCQAAISPLLFDFIDRAFDGFPLRKLVVMLGSDDFELPKGLADVVRCAGSLREHVRRRAEQYADLNLYEIWRESWLSSRVSSGGPNT
jgi:hypothetical protein